LLKFVLPKIECEASTKNYGRFIISPMETGYGVTIGNALRRILLSSLSGAAVTSLRVSGVYHEFSDIPNAKEDMTALILNVKKLRLRYFAEEPVRLTLSTRGRSEVTAADIECPPDVELINPELHLLTLDSSAAELDIEFTVERGKGYSPAEERGQLPIGQIPMDAVFAPVLRTSFSVEQTRVGQVTDYDRLILEVWTDGTIRPAEALSSSAQILVRHLDPIASFSEVHPEGLEEVAAEEEGIPTRVYETPIEVLELSVRAYNCLKRAGITKLGEILDKVSKGQGKELLAIRNFGEKSLEELMAKLLEKGYLAEEGAVLGLPLETLELPTRVYNALMGGGIETVGDALEKLSVGEGEELLAVPNFGQKSLDELIERLQEKDYLPDDWAERNDE
jgi:DNA-directed RNA polymerase subunit alpha